ncbi:MAG: hypothetical protein IJW73_01565, partial [Candidatus Gastranaerophilales bacterium]|nr:hypothetical protein [Candidatus Gastranaerophilales bacterium]
KDSKKVLIKEKIGSVIGGIYKTNLYVHILASDVENSKTIKLDNLDETIKHYFLDWENKQLIKYKYDIQPLGFNDANDNEIITICWVMDNDNNKINLGIWSYDIEANEIKILEEIPTISINGLFLKETF